MQSILVGELKSKISLAKKFNIIPRSTSELEFKCTQFFQAISIEHWPTSTRQATNRNKNTRRISAISLRIQPKYIRKHIKSAKDPNQKSDTVPTKTRI